MRRLLTDAEIERLPADVRDHYRHHDYLRHIDDVPYFPDFKREWFEAQHARSVARVVEHIRSREGDQAAEEAAAAVKEARAERDRLALHLAQAS